MSKKHVSLGSYRQRPSELSLTTSIRIQRPSDPNPALQADIERELTIAEMIDHSPLNPCECLQLSRESTSKLWALANMLITFYDTYDGFSGLIYFVKAMKTHMQVELYGCKVRTTVLTCLLQVVDLMTALLYLGASLGFFLAVFHFDKDHKKTRLRLSKMYMYACMAFIPVVGHFFLFVNNIRNCSSIFQFDSVYIISISVFISTCLLGYVVTKSFVYLVENPEMQGAEEQDFFLRTGRRGTVASHVSRSASHSSSLGRGHTHSRPSSMTNMQDNRRATLQPGHHAPSTAARRDTNITKAKTMGKTAKK